MSVTTNTLAGPEAPGFWNPLIDQELHSGWTKTWGPDTGMYAASGNRKAAMRTLAVTAVTTALGGAKALRLGAAKAKRKEKPKKNQREAQKTNAKNAPCFPLPVPRPSRRRAIPSRHPTAPSRHQTRPAKPLRTPRHRSRTAKAAPPAAEFSRDREQMPKKPLS